jgi:peptidoglycan hydrolase FlgJ
MSIKPPSDIVLDVARNADADLAATATRRLEALASTQATDLPKFSAALEGVAPKPSHDGEANPGKLRLASSPQGGSFNGVARGKEVAQQFEATVLSAFVNEAMPKNSYYGQGTAGEIWKSMLSDQIAHQLAKSGSLGIARRLFARGPLGEAAGSDGVRTAMGNALHGAAQSSSLPLSMPTSLDSGAGAMGLANRRRS